MREGVAATASDHGRVRAPNGHHSNDVRRVLVVVDVVLGLARQHSQNASPQLTVYSLPALGSVAIRK